MMKNTTRIVWLDNLKAIGILLVVFGHMIPDSIIKQYIYSFHVPLFFFVSGCLFNRSKYDFGRFFKKKFSTLIIPYFFFASISVLFWFFVVRSLSIDGKALLIDPLKPLVGIFYGIGSGDWKVPMNVALWFLPCLFIVEIVFYFVRNVYFLLVFAVLGYIVCLLPVRIPWSADVALSAIVFYGIGYFYKDQWVKNKLILLFLFLHLTFCFLNSPVDMNNLSYGNIFYFYVSALSGVLLYVAISKYLINIGIINYIGKNTVIIIGLVGITWFIMNGIYYLIFELKLAHAELGFSLAASLAQILMTIPAIYIINRWFPYILGRPKSHPFEGKAHNCH